MLRVHLEHNAKATDTLRYRTARPGSFLRTGAGCGLCGCANKLVHELRYIPHDKSAMVGVDDDNADSDMEGKEAMATTTVQGLEDPRAPAQPVLAMRISGYACCCNLYVQQAALHGGAAGLGIHLCASQLPGARCDALE